MKSCTFDTSVDFGALSEERAPMACLHELARLSEAGAFVSFVPACPQKTTMVTTRSSLMCRASHQTPQTHLQAALHLFD
jgi:hypothetical protein